MSLMLPMLDLLNTTGAAQSGGGIAAGIGACLGLLIGSFLNVVIHRLPRMMEREAENYLAHETGAPVPHTDRYNLWAPRSSCPQCAAPVRPAHNIPLLSYLFLRGRCKDCGTAISLHYPAVEIVSALLSGVVAWHFGLGATGLAALAFTYFLIAMSFIDAQTQLLPDSLTLPLLWLGLLVNVNAVFVPLHDAVIGAAAGYLALWAIYWIFKLATGKEGMGYGDFKLMAALGAWLGWQALPLLLLLASIVGAAIGLIMLAAKRHEAGQTIPFGPYLALAGMMLLLYGKSVTLFSLN